MSEIDNYQHECIGIIHCPSSYPLVSNNDSQHEIPLYRLSEDTLNAVSWHAKQGDLLLGGGSGESAAVRFSIPEAIYFFTRDGWDDFEDFNTICRVFWTANQAFVFCDGYRQLGWNPAERIELWLAEHIVAFVLREYPAQYRQFQGSGVLQKDGSICRLPTPQEAQML
ncbi:MAG: hypothetical protein L0332_28705 [Chloroflexi bacterium]|nr:hypothetical protein [Chloroflexota bacterium]MCI0644107.1 hypothetical protein [Chloroflexota bacterium]MCI0730680.1 hypothetical protein [Chloroflexota bacterium]